MSILVPLFSALLAAGSYIRIPLGPVAITLQTLFLFMLALLLPPKKALSSVLLYLFLGAIGFPVFTSGGGLAGILGPTGGFLIAMVPASLVGSYLARKNKKKRIVFSATILLLMNAILYLLGLFWMAYKLNINFKSAFITGCAPFLAFDAIKISVALATSNKIYDKVESILRNEEQN